MGKFVLRLLLRSSTCPLSYACTTYTYLVRPTIFLGLRVPPCDIEREPFMKSCPETLNTIGEKSPVLGAAGRPRQPARRSGMTIGSVRPRPRATATGLICSPNVTFREGCIITIDDRARETPLQHHEPKCQTPI